MGMDIPKWISVASFQSFPLATTKPEGMISHASDTASPNTYLLSPNVAET